MKPIDLRGISNKFWEINKAAYLAIFPLFNIKINWKKFINFNSISVR